MSVFIAIIVISKIEQKATLTESPIGGTTGQHKDTAAA